MSAICRVEADDMLLRLIDFVEDAGELALSLRDEGLTISYKGKGFGQALTQADLAISRLLHQRFDDRVIEEETALSLGYSNARRMLAENDWTFIADPIDGTKPFISGLSGWGTMIAACQSGWPIMSALSLPAWFDDRTAPAISRSSNEERGILLAASDRGAFWAPTQGGRRVMALQPLSQPRLQTNHIAWQPGLAQRYTLNYELGYFPWCESSSISEAALIATGRLDAAPLNSSLWDSAPILPLLQACGLGLYRWPDLAPRPSSIIELVDELFSGRSALWLACRDAEQAEGLSNAIRLNPLWR